MGEVKLPSPQPTTAPLGFWESAVGRSVRRLLVLAASGALSALLAAATKDPATFGVGTPVIYWVVRTLLDLLNPKVSNL